jgi:hypothetical protein
MGLGFNHREGESWLCPEQAVAAANAQAAEHLAEVERLREQLARSNGQSQ